MSPTNGGPAKDRPTGVEEAPADAPASDGQRVARRLLAAAFIALVTVHVALFWVATVPEPRQPFGDELMYLRKAEQMAAGDDWHPGQFWPLLQARLLALIFARGGGAVAVAAVQTAMLAAAAVVVGLLGTRLTGSSTAGWVAAFLLAADPQVAAFAHYYWPEVLHLLLFFGAWLLIVSRPRQLAALAVAGVLLGLALVTKNHMLLFVPALYLPAALARGSRVDRVARAVVLFGALGATVVAIDRLHAQPMAPRHQAVSSALFNVWVGLTDTSRRSFVDERVPEAMRIYREGGETVVARNRAVLGRIRALLAERGVVGTLRGQLGRQPYRLLDRRSFLTDQLPGGPIVTTRGRGYRRASPVISAFLRFASYGVYTAVLVLAMVGVVSLPAAARRRMLLVAAFLAFNLGLFLLIHVKSRYRIQLMPVLDILAGVGVAAVAARWGWNPSERLLFAPPSAPAARAAAVAGGALLLWYAWGG